MFSRYALIRKSDGLVVNSVKADADFVPAPDLTKQADADGVLAIGGTYLGGVYTPAPAPVPPPPPDYAAIDQDALNAALVEPGSVMRSLAMVTLSEINKLRVLNGVAAYTLDQFKAALKAQMR